MLQLDSINLSAETLPTEIDPQVAEQARALGEQQLQMLTRLAEFGLELAAETVRRAKAEPLGADAGEGNFGLVYGRIARAVRMTLALQSRVMKELLALEQARAGAREARSAAEAEPDPVQARRDRVDSIVRRVIEAEHDDDETVERLTSDVWERLADDDIYGDISQRPMGEIVALICADLGLSPDWRRLAREAWAVDEAASGAAGSPFAAGAFADVVSRAGPWPPIGFNPHAASP